MVVVEPDQRVGSVVQLGNDSLGEAAVDRLVPVAPRGVERVVEFGSDGPVPERVQEEPEEGIRDRVVVEVVGARVVHDEPDAGRRVGGERAILVAHRTGDPDDVVTLLQAAKRGDEPAGAASHRSTVRDDDQRPGQDGIRRGA
jgi:hypothetical protein